MVFAINALITIKAKWVQWFCDLVLIVRLLARTFACCSMPKKTFVLCFSSIRCVYNSVILTSQKPVRCCNLVYRKRLLHGIKSYLYLVKHVAYKVMYNLWDRWLRLRMKHFGVKRSPYGFVVNNPWIPFFSNAWYCQSIFYVRFFSPVFYGLSSYR